MDEEHEFLLYEASVRQDRPPLQASQITQAVVCPASAAFSAACDEAHMGHTLGSGPLWLPWATAEEPEEVVLEEGQLSDVRLSMLADGVVAKLGNEEGGPIVQARAPYLWAEPDRLVRDGGGWRCPTGTSLHLSGVLDRAGTIVFPRDFGELLCAGVLSWFWVRASGDLVLTVHGRDDSLTVMLPAGQVTLLMQQLRRAVARVEGQRQRLTKGERLDFFPGSHCEDCALSLRCDVWAGAARAVALSLPSGDIDPASVVLALDWLHSTTRMAQSMLRRHVTAHGPIKMPDGSSWDNHAYEFKTWPASHVARTIDLEVGKNLSNEAVRISEHEVKKGLLRATRLETFERDKIRPLLDKVGERMRELGEERVTELHRYGRASKGVEPWE